MSRHSEVIRDNFTFLCDNTNITERLLDKCMEVEILTRDESVEIEQYSGYKRSRKFYETITRKDNEAFKKLVDIMESKDNRQSCEVLDILKTCKMYMTSLEPKFKTLKSRWWPEERNFDLLNSFHERKIKEKLFVEELHNMLTHNSNGTAVISQKVAVSGLGGVGKTTTAKWYANHYKDFYYHIIWLDCGEGSLLKSFRDLARDLEIKNRQDLDLTKLARESFSALEEFKCLWIFDNAECYTGNEGIRDVLPRNGNFHAIITSRNRDWGSDTGYGKISQFQLDVFDIEESTTFMRKNLQRKSFHDGDLKQLCQLLGNLPLALQIAAASMNRQNIKLSDYIERVEKTDHIISKNFDDYEKTVNATLKTSLEFIKYNENDSKQLAYRILLTFGYIQPDNVEIRFFEKVEESSIWEIQEAMDLLETYSLISKGRTLEDNSSEDEIDMFDYSIHRLLQQVTRHNGRDTESDTIRKILNCEDFLNYKLIPFGFADEELKNEFPTIRVQLIDQLELSQLIKERKFTDALQLSEIIKDTMKSSASDFNYAICLKNRKQFKASLEIFNRIYNTVSNSRIGPQFKRYSDNTLQTELLDLNSEPTKNLVGSQLFIIHLQEKRFKMANEILSREMSVSLRNSEDILLCILEALRTNNIISELGLYKLVIDGDTICISLENSSKREIVFENCEVDVTLNLPECLDRLELHRVRPKVDNIKKRNHLIDLSDFIPSSVIDLYVYFELCHSYYLNDVEGIICYGMVTLKKLTSINTIRLKNCKLNLSDKQLKVSPEILEFANVTLVRNGTEAFGVIFLHELINFHQIKNITLTANEIILKETLDEMDTTQKLPHEKYVSKIGLEKTGSCARSKMVALVGDQIIISDWNINPLQVPFEKTQLKLTLLKITKSTIKLSSLPGTIETLILASEAQVMSEKEDFVLPNLKYLHVEFSSGNSVDIPFLLRVCRNLIGLKLEANSRARYDVEDLKVDLNSILNCTSIKTLKLIRIEALCRGVITINKLILCGYNLKKICQILKQFHPDQLLVYSGIPDRNDQKVLLSLIQRPLSLIVGYIHWQNFKTSPLANYVDAESNFYIFGNQRGCMITREEFWRIGQFPGENVFETR